MRVGEKGLDLGDKEIGLGERSIGEGVSNQGLEVVGVCGVGGFRCPRIWTGEKNGASGENTIGVVVGVRVVVGVKLGWGGVPGDMIEDGGLQGSAHKVALERDGELVTGAVVVAVEVFG